MVREELSTLGQYIVALCKAQNLSLRQASMRAGLDPTTISKILNREETNTPQPATLEKLAAALNGDYYRMMVLAGHLPPAGEAELERLQRKLADLAPKRQRLALAYAEGKMDLSIYYEADGELRNHEDSARVRLAEVRTLLTTRPDPEVRRQYIEQLLEQGVNLSALDPDVLGSALHRAGVQVYVEDRKVVFCAFAL